MKYILELYYQGDCLEQREYQEAIIPPDKGDKMYIEFQNKNYSEEYGNWWIVRQKRYLLFTTSLKMQTLQLYCEPDPEKGAIP